jgi:hypothetical protein
MPEPVARNCLADASEGEMSAVELRVRIDEQPELRLCHWSAGTTLTFFISEISSERSQQRGEAIG